MDKIKHIIKQKTNICLAADVDNSKDLFSLIEKLVIIYVF